jgi:large conductance mechanosensitive channel
MLKGFKDFLLRGNVVDLAVAVVIGAAFTAVVTSFTKSFLEPLLRLFSGGENAIPPGTIPLTDEVQLDYASFLNAIVTFFITAAVIYFLVVFPMKWLQERRRRGEEDGPAESTDVELLTEIRDLLLAQEARAERQDALGTGGPQARTTHLPPQPPNGYEPYPDSPYQEPARTQQAPVPRPAEPAYAGRDFSEPAHAEPTRPQPRPSGLAVDGVQPPPRRRRHADPRS